jgi:putative solute:sodium symporter small subunit
MVPMSTQDNASAYWSENLRIITTYLSVWFVVSYVCGILLVDSLDAIPFFGFPLGFWIAQQGAIFIYVALIWMYVSSMNKLDEKYDVHE